MRSPSLCAIVLPGKQSNGVEVRDASACVQSLVAGAVKPDKVLLISCECNQSDSSSTKSDIPIHRLDEPTVSTWSERLNLGVSSSSTDLIAVIHADCEAHTHWLAQLTEFLQHHSEVAGVEGNVSVSIGASPYFPAARRVGRIEVDAPSLKWTSVESESDSPPREVACLSPVAFLLRGAALSDLGKVPLDNRFGRSFATRDLFARLMERNWRLFHLASAEVRTTDALQPDSLRGDSARQKEMLLFAWKHLSKPQREHHLARMRAQSQEGFRGLFERPTPETTAAREALAWIRAHQERLTAERVAGGAEGDAFERAANAAQARARYSFHVRQEIIDLVPAQAKVILDVGCAAGALGNALKRQRPTVTVLGVEISAEAADRARTVLDEVFCGRAEDALPDAWPKPDCTIFADVLEHLPDPWQVLRRHRDLLGPGGTLIVSVPNIGHRTVIAELLRGKFEYADAGILDRTHLRFFTRSSAVDLLENSGFRVECVTRNLDPTVEPPWLQIAQRLLPGSSFLRDLNAVQFVIVATVPSV